MIIVTNSKDPTFICEFDFTTNKFTYCGYLAIPEIKDEDIVTTNKAGDSFAGGFLYSYLCKSRNIEEAFQTGCYASTLVITNQLKLNNY